MQVETLLLTDNGEYEFPIEAVGLPYNIALKAEDVGGDHGSGGWSGAGAEVYCNCGPNGAWSYIIGADMNLNDDSKSFIPLGDRIKVVLSGGTSHSLQFHLRRVQAGAPF